MRPESVATVGSDALAADMEAAVAVTGLARCRASHPYRRHRRGER
jgi:hypothetical protein